MGGYGITIRELVEIAGSATAVLKMNSPVMIDPFDGDDFAVCDTKARTPAIGGNLEPVAGGDFDRPPFKHIKRLALLTGDLPQRSAVIPSDCVRSFDPENLEGVVLCDPFDSAVKSQELSRTEIADIALLSRRPVQRNIAQELPTFTEPARSLSLQPDR